MDQWKLTLQNCDVPTLINDTLWLIQSAAENNQPRILVDFPANLPPVFVDKTLMRQALLRVMRRAIQTSPQAIRLTAAVQDRFLVIQMHHPDGISWTAERDWQVAQRIIREQGGRMELEDDSAQPSRITLHLPLAGQTQILVIDDHQAILQLFERYLAPHHYEVKKAQSGLEGLAMAAENPPDLIILDVMMPAMDGWQVLRSLKQNPITQEIPIIICSVLKEPELALSLGAQVYLKKPVDRLDLLKTVEQLLSL